VDLNGDGIADVTSGQYWPGIVTFFEGSQTGLKKGAVIPEVGVEQAKTNDMKFAQSTASFVDWDGDGDLDMLIGSVFGDIFININEGTPKQFKFGQRVPLMAAGKPMKVAASKSDPLCVDWDGDGVLDILSGDDSGGVGSFRGIKPTTGNARTFEAPVPVMLGKTKNMVPGFRARLAVADWNNDGKLDLLVGNCEQTTGPKPELTGYVYLFLRK